MSFYDKLIELENLKTDDDSGVARKRGLDFEKLVRDIFLKQNLLSIIKQSGYHTSDGKSEQIDGVVSFDGKVFLLEVKWDKNLAASSLYEFIGKIENKFFGTLGIFISYHPLSENFIDALRKGRKQNVIVLHGEDVKLLFKKEINLKLFLKYAYEKLCFDNLSYISVKEFIEFTKEKGSYKVISSTDDEKVKFFIGSNIDTRNSISDYEMEIEIGKLSEEEKAKVYLILFRQATNLLKFRFPIPASYSNARTFFSIYYSPDFEIDILRDLPNQYFSEFIFKEPKLYLSNFLKTFLEEFPNISSNSRKKFESRIIDLYNRSDWDVENELTLILENNESSFTPSILKEIYKLYINFYYSLSRDNRFPQKAYAIKLLKSRKLDKDTILEWIDNKVLDELKWYKNNPEDFNILYFSKTYFELGQILGLTEREWVDKIRNFYKKHTR
jgi:hypothetical protein